jgi:hypothetical protein
MAGVNRRIVVQASLGKTLFKRKKLKQKGLEA